MPSSQNAATCTGVMKSRAATSSQSLGWTPHFEVTLSLDPAQGAKIEEWLQAGGSEHRADPGLR